VFSVGEDGNWSFATAPQNFSAFFPDQQVEWCGHGTGSNCYSVDLSTAAGSLDVRLMFEAYSGSGNNLFVDNININITSYSGVNNLRDDHEISIYPNPVADQLNIYSKRMSGIIDFSLLNIQGQQIKYKRLIFNSSVNVATIDVSDVAPGVYFVKLFNHDFVRVIRIIHN
jgi:hypothetical protein